MLTPEEAVDIIYSNMNHGNGQQFMELWGSYNLNDMPWEEILEWQDMQIGFHSGPEKSYIIAVPKCMLEDHINRLANEHDVSVENISATVIGRVVDCLLVEYIVRVPVKVIVLRDWEGNIINMTTADGLPVEMHEVSYDKQGDVAHYVLEQFDAGHVVGSVQQEIAQYSLLAQAQEQTIMNNPDILREHTSHNLRRRMKGKALQIICSQCGDTLVLETT